MEAKTKIILVATITLLIGLIAGYLFSKSERYEGMMGNRDERFLDADERGLNDTAGMHDMGGMHNMGGMNSNEQSFIEGMIPHHEEAVATAKQVIARGGTTPAVMQLAKDIVTAQEKEIADMKSWYKAWYGKDYQDDGSYQPMMRELSSLSGAELDRAFLEDMIMHHMGALMMAQAVASNIEHDEMRALAEAIAETQSAEIIQMRTLLKQIPAN